MGIRPNSPTTINSRPARFKPFSRNALFLRDRTGRRKRRFVSKLNSFPIPSQSLSNFRRLDAVSLREKRARRGAHAFELLCIRRRGWNGKIEGGEQSD